MLDTYFAVAVSFVYTCYLTSNNQTCNQPDCISTGLKTQVQEQNTRACLSRQRTTGLAYKISRNNTQWAKEKKGHL